MPDEPGFAAAFAPSAISFGCGNVGGLMITASEADRRRAVEYAVDRGVTYFDTAALYGRGVSEENLGQSLQGIRDKVLIGTKVFLHTEHRDDLASAVANSVTQSLGRLGVDSVDLVQLHNSVDTRPDAVSLGEDDVIDAVLPALERLRRDGKTRFVGISGHGSTDSILKVVGQDGIDSVQVVYNLLNPSAGQDVPAGYPAQDYRLLLDRMQDKGMTALGIRTLAGGALTGSEARHPIGAQVVDPLGSGPSYASDVEQARRFLPLIEAGESSSLTELAVRYALSNADIGSLVIGFSSVEQIEEVLDWSALGPLSPSVLAGIEQIRAGFVSDPTS